jgi:DNA-binding GntR family transcriptional regulator
MAQGPPLGSRPEIGPHMDDGLQSVKRQTLADNVYVQLKTAIMRGRLRDGTELKQGELAAQLGVSRVPVREALRRLQAEHLVVAEPFQCFVVTSLSADQVTELLELREELEVFALKKTMAPDVKNQRVQAAITAMKSLSLGQEDELWLAADREFHRELNGPTTAVATIIEDVRERVHRYYLSAPALLQRRREVLQEHETILAALDADDEDALEHAIRHHVRATRQHLQQSMVDAGPAEVQNAPLLFAARGAHPPR